MLHVHSLTCDGRNYPYGRANEDLLREWSIGHVCLPGDSEKRDNGDGEDREVGSLHLINTPFPDTKGSSGNAHLD